MTADLTFITVVALGIGVSITVLISVLVELYVDRDKRDREGET